MAPEAAAMLYALSARIEKPLHAGKRTTWAGTLVGRPSMVAGQQGVTAVWRKDGCIRFCGVLPTSACTADPCSVCCQLPGLLLVLPRFGRPAVACDTHAGVRCLLHLELRLHAMQGRARCTGSCCGIARRSGLRLGAAAMAPPVARTCRT